MSEGKRPGGLTALAVINFVFAGFDVLALFGLFILVTAADAATKAEVSKTMSTGMIYVSIVMVTAVATLLIASGVGYLKQKKTLGRTLGTVYGALGLLGTAVSLAAGQEFGIMTLVGLVYPVLTLILVNTTFKDDLVN